METRIKAGLDVPDDYREKPRIYTGDDVFLKAFHRLSRSRPPSMEGMTPIPWDKIDDYARRIGYANPDEFCAILEVMDGAFLSWYRETYG